MEEKEERQRISIVAWASWAVLALLAYVGSSIPIVLLGGLGYLDWIYNSPIQYAFNIYCLPLQMLANNFPPYNNLLEFLHKLVA